MGLADIEITEADGCVKLSSGGQVFARCNDKEHAETIKKALELCEQDIYAFACVVDADDHRDIMEAVERRKAWDCEPDESDSCDLGGMIAEICRGWMERVEHDKTASSHVFVGETDDESDCIGAALAKWRKTHPEAKIDHATTLADILADWMDRVEHEQREYAENCKAARWVKDANSYRTDNCDGTVTFHGIDVTVRADVLEGRDVLAVRQPKRGEKYLGTDGIVADAEYDWDSARTGVRVILGPKPQPPVPSQPAFREGRYYRRRNGDIVGPLVRHDKGVYSWQGECCGKTWLYFADGRIHDDRESNVDLLPGEVIVWRHPGLKAGEYRWRNGMFGTSSSSWTYNRSVVDDLFATWTDPPRVGKWKVVEGQEYATWEGE